MCSCQTIWTQTSFYLLSLTLCERDGNKLLGRTSEMHYMTFRPKINLITMVVYLTLAHKFPLDLVVYNPF